MHNACTSYAPGFRRHEKVNDARECRRGGNVRGMGALGREMHERGRRLEMQRPATPDAETVARRAHEIWEQEGRPEGRHQEHWQTAERELSAAPEDDAGPEPVAGDEDAAAPAGTPL
jgi:hypothetical protein